MRSPVHADTMCKACKRRANIQRAAARLPKQVSETKPAPAVQSSSPDPCPVCSVTQAAHWKCKRCGSRGHQMGRGTVFPALCGWCEADAMKAETQQMKEAA